MIKTGMKHLFTGALLSVLLACSSPISQRTSPTPQPKPQPTVTPAVAQEGRVAVRNFLAVIDAVEPVAEAECRARTRGRDCDFKIVVDDRPGLPPNAYQTLDDSNRPILAFTIPLIAGVKNQDEMAFIMAHEAAHHIRGHLDRLQQNATIGAVVAGSLAGVLGAADPDAIEAAQQFGATLGARSYSKDFELEADELGTVIAAEAGFNPLIGAEYFFRIPNPGDRFLGTHPANEARVATVRRTAALYGYR